MYVPKTFEEAIVTEDIAKTAIFDTIPKRFNLESIVLS